MPLDDRKKLILQAIVEDYIQNAEPVGSRSIAKKTELGLSAATIRNEMGDLEEMGLLAQPHTSAGRVPSELGFRFYVDTLMKKAQLTANEIEILSSIMVSKFNELDKIVRAASSAFSGITNLPTFGILPNTKGGAIQSIKVVVVDSATIMVIISDCAGVIKNKLLRLKGEVSQSFIDKLNTILNENLAGMTRSEIKLENIMQVKNAVGENLEILSSVLELVYEAITEFDNREVFMEGGTNILRFPEYKNIEKIKEIFEFFDNKSHIGELAEAVTMNDDGSVKVFIGDENVIPELKNNSVVITTYKVRDDLVGMVGVIGPVRMDYAKVVSGMEYFSKQLGEILDKSFGHALGTAKDKGDDKDEQE